MTCDSRLQIRKTPNKIQHTNIIPKMREMKIPKTGTQMNIKKTVFKSQIQINLSKWKRILFKMAILGPPITEMLSTTERTSLLRLFYQKSIITQNILIFYFLTFCNQNVFYYLFINEYPSAF